MINVEKKFILKLDNYIQKGNCMSGFVANGGVQTLLGSIGDTITTALWDMVGWIFWLLCDIFFQILDFLEIIFRKLAGMDPVYVDGEKQEGDLVLYLIKSDVVQNIFFSILMLSLFLLIIFTVVAIVKNQYVDKPKPVMNIISDSFKGLLMYLLVPIATIVCLMVGNVILQAIDGATRTGTSGSASDMLFLAAAYKANRLRCGDDFDENKEAFIELYEDGDLHPLYFELKNNYGISSVADIEALDENHGGAEIIASVADLIDAEYTEGRLSGSWGNKWNHASVKYYYKPWSINLLTVWVGGAFLIWAYGKMAWGVASRLYKMTIGYAISPALMAMYPLDQGQKLGAWKSDMVKNGTMAYCAVGVLNILYSIMPLFLELDIFKGENLATAIYGQFIKLFLIIIAYSGASKLIEQVSGWFGTGNALAEGIAQADAAKKAAKGAVSKVGGVRKKAVGAYQGIRGGAARAKDYANAKGQTGFKAGATTFLGGLYGAYKGSGLSDAVGVDPVAIGKEWNEARKAGETAFQDLATNTYNKDMNKANKGIFERVDELDKLKKRLDAIGYDPAKDDGSEESIKKREQMIAASEAGNAISKKQQIELDKSKKDLATTQKLMTLVDAVDSAMQEQQILNAQLAATTDPTAQAEINAQIARAEQRFNTAKTALQTAYNNDTDLKARANKTKLFDVSGNVDETKVGTVSSSLSTAISKTEAKITVDEDALQRKKADINTRLAIYGAVLDPAGIKGLTADELKDYNIWIKTRSQ